MAEGNWQVLALIPDGYIEIDTNSGRKRHVQFGHGTRPQRKRPMGVTIGCESFASLDLVPQEMMQG
jgi:hypothetical protein